MMYFIRIICAIFLPPLGVFLQVSFGKSFWLNILLMVLGIMVGTQFGFPKYGVVPAILHAVWVTANQYQD
ncbi:MAG: YqaE/Pmp3 family membrane protein [Moorea sp. SIO3C2]|nr:YqaE/Pmp3 family membrane protein [Moorena sp. SIO3C2]